MTPLEFRRSRRRFLQESISWSAMAVAPSLPALASNTDHPGAAHALAIGDWGWAEKTSKEALEVGPGYRAQSMVARGMANYLRRAALHPDALMLLGDSWYGDLVEGSKSTRWLDQFERMYPSETFACPAYTMLGNHDYQYMPLEINKVEAELEYSRLGRGCDGRPTRWTLPARWYGFSFPRTRPLIRFLVLDSNVPPTNGAPLKHGPNFTLTEAQYAEQLSWLRQELQRPRTTPFLAVLAHHPVFSNGPHGDHPTLVRDWDPLFRQHGVDLYMAGHDHDLQHLEFDGHPTTHFLSGGGGADLYVLKIDDLDRGPYAQEVHGFSHLSVTARELRLRHLDADGRLLYAIRKGPGSAARPL